MFELSNFIGVTAVSVGAMVYVGVVVILLLAMDLLAVSVGAVALKQDSSN